MIPLTLSEIASHIGGELIGDDTLIESVSTDTRSTDQNDLFVALKGPRFDAHEFLQQAIENGAKALMVSQRSSLDASQIIVKNTLIGLGKLSALVRQKSSAKVIGLTGSVGKTTVKEMIASITKRLGKTVATAGNLNNEVGVPLTLLRLNANTEYAVIEMGANHHGEIDYTTHLVQPDVALINNVAAAHLEGFGDLHGVARAKAEIFRGLASNGSAVINRDDDFFEYWHGNTKQDQMDYSVETDARVSAKNILENEDNSFNFDLSYDDQLTPIHLTVPGKHNIANALAAAACCLSLNIDRTEIANGLSEFKGVKGRLQILRVSPNFMVIDDTYNANYTSLTAAINVLSKQPGFKILALGDMGELGGSAKEYHQKAGQFAKQSNIDLLLTIGELSFFASQAFGENAIHCQTQAELIEKIKQQQKEKAVSVLMKGSRSAHMDKIVNQLVESIPEINSGGRH
ncbi:MAG: UDP-N-acetylmuramoyl-tripeptide--D-alanyl-D-alanine ligase [Gammaproteobacteria bacterium]|nr:UDP-N-acetylmuramoyl-tripeptide--D-alanyl-D-alanine ligase [Gammaproteobacteria bacterium]